MSIYQVIHAGTHKGFDISYEFAHEDLRLEDMLDDDHFCIRDMYQEINDGDLAFFQVTCVAKREGLRLGHATLGGCIYSNESEFLADDYAADLLDEAINEARQVLSNLIERVA